MTANDINHCSEHPSVDSSNRFAIDQLLRAKGFKIHSRCSGQEPVWERQKDQLTQGEALQSLLKKDVEEAVKKEDEYFNQILKKHGYEPIADPEPTTRRKPKSSSSEKASR